MFIRVFSTRLELNTLIPEYYSQAFSMGKNIKKVLKINIKPHGRYLNVSQREEWEWYVSLVVKLNSSMVCPTAWVCRLIVQVIFIPVSAIITKPHLIMLHQLHLEGSRKIDTSQTDTYLFLVIGLIQWRSSVKMKSVGYFMDLIINRTYVLFDPIECQYQNF